VYSVSQIGPAALRQAPRQRVYLGALALLGYVALAVLVTAGPERQPSWTGPPNPDPTFMVAMNVADVGLMEFAP
jgi:hypothetical protein